MTNSARALLNNASDTAHWANPSSNEFHDQAEQHNGAFQNLSVCTCNCVKINYWQPWSTGTFSRDEMCHREWSARAPQAWNVQSNPQRRTSWWRECAHSSFRTRNQVISWRIVTITFYPENSWEILENPFKTRIDLIEINILELAKNLAIS